MMCEKFVNSGVFFQNISKNYEEAVYRFDNSCYRCSMWGLQIHCDGCGIRDAYIKNCKRFGVQPPADA